MNLCLDTSELKCISEVDRIYVFLLKAKLLTLAFSF